MVILVENPQPGWNWRRQVTYAIIGLAVSLGIGFALRATELPPATRSFISMLPMWFLLTLGSPMAGPQHPIDVRLARAAAYSVVVDLVYYALMLASA